jgi:hypothetical protein
MTHNINNKISIIICEYEDTINLWITIIKNQLDFYSDDLYNIDSEYYI